MDNMRAIALDHSAELGGAEVGLASMADEFGDDLRIVLLENGPLALKLQESGHQPTILEINAKIGRQIRKRSILRLPFLELTSAVLELRRELLRIADEHGANTIVLNSFRAITLTAACILPRRVKCVSMVRDSARPPYLSYANSLIARLAVNLVSNTVVANSNWTAAQFRTFRPVRVVPPFIAEKFYSAPMAHSEESDTRVRVLLLGRMAEWKGQLMALKAVENLLTSRDWSLTLAGGPWFSEDRYYEQVQEAAHFSRFAVDILGHVDDVVGLIDRHDIVLHTSTIPEPFGQVVVQAMSRGKLIIAADQGGPSEIITHMRDGMLYQMADQDALTSCLDQALDNFANLHDVRARARESARDYHPSRTKQIIADIVHAVAAKAPST